MTKVSVAMPVMYCPNCRHQLLQHAHVLVGTDTLVCVFCARDRAQTSGETFAALASEYDGFVPGSASPLDPMDAAALLARRGATVIEP